MLIFYFFWRTTGSNTEVKKSSIYGITVEVTQNGVEFIVTTTFFSPQVAYVVRLTVNSNATMPRSPLLRFKLVMMFKLKEKRPYQG
jgi:hypothetical protein